MAPRWLCEHQLRSLCRSVILNSLPHNIVRLAKIIFLLIMFSHWNACIQYLIAAWEGFPADSWVVRADILEAGGKPLPYGDAIAMRYTWSLFNAFSQVPCACGVRVPWPRAASSDARPPPTSPPCDEPRPRRPVTCSHRLCRWSPWLTLFPAPNHCVSRRSGSACSR